MNHSGDTDEPALSFEEFSQLKEADRAELAALPANVAQAAVDRILHPRLWTIQDPQQLIWPGDLADEED